MRCCHLGHGSCHLRQPCKGKQVCWQLGGESGLGSRGQKLQEWELRDEEGVAPPSSMLASVLATATVAVSSSTVRPFAGTVVLLIVTVAAMLVAGVGVW